MRYRLAWDGEWVSAVLAVFLRVVGGWYRRQAQALGNSHARSASRLQRIRGLRQTPADHRRPDRSGLAPDLSGGGRDAGDDPGVGPCQGPA